MLMLYPFFLENANHCSDLTRHPNAGARVSMNSASLLLHPSMSSGTLPPWIPLCIQLQMYFCGVMFFIFLILKFSSAHPPSPL